MTDNAKHTPGPWDIGNENNETCEVCLNSPHNLTVSIDRHDHNTGVIVISRDEMLANAHLIAAAPEMFGALNNALDLVNNGVISVKGSDRDLFLAALEKWNSAIDKAMGSV